MLAGKSAKGDKTEAAIRAGLLALLAKRSLADITVSELCRASEVSRGTFYLHFNSVTDVYDQCMKALVSEASPITSMARCPSGCALEGQTSFCELVRDAREYRPIVREGRFLESYLKANTRLAPDSLERSLVEAGLDMQQARAIATFQTGGCHAAATQLHVPDRDWPKIRATIDRFVMGGIEALRK